MRVLLHTCCAPCLLYPLERLEKNGCEVIGYFYNPNIHPALEYEKRKEAVENISKRMDIKVMYPSYDPAVFFRAIQGQESRPYRCGLCWAMRLEQTANEAGALGCEYFSTTLLVSPYQDQELLAHIGSEIAQKTGVAFYYEDFRPGFRQAHKQAKELDLYCQKYCGCMYSEAERCKKSPRP